MAEAAPGRRGWHHGPEHRFIPDAAYMVTAGTYNKELLFDTPAKLDFLHNTLLEEAERFAWRLQAWAVMANHYHFIAHAPEDPKTLVLLTKRLHSTTARWLNRRDGRSGRKVWHNYWDTCLTYEASYFARLHYVHRNPVKHGLVENAEAYPWCSMGWFLRHADPVFRNQILSYRIGKLSVWDPF
jgi:putative transposase